MATLLWAAAALLAGCGQRDGVSQEWSESETSCVPNLDVSVQAGSDADVRVRVTNGPAQSEVQFAYTENKWRGWVPWRGDASVGPQLEIVLRRGGAVQRFAHSVPPYQPPARLWKGDFTQPEALAPLSVSLKQPGRFDETGDARARVSGDQLFADVPICFVTAASGADGAVEFAPGRLTYQLPLARLTGARQGEQPEFAVTVNGARDALRIAVPRTTVAAAIFADVEKMPKRDAPPYRRGLPLLLLEEGGVPQILNRPEASLADIAAVARRQKTDVEDACSYARHKQGIAQVFVARIRHDISVSVREARTGALVASKTFRGAEPPACPEAVRVEGVAVFQQPLDGDAPDSNAILDWLKGF